MVANGDFCGAHPTHQFSKDKYILAATEAVVKE
jgi:hypothetical protein